jgi:hypothetical protein
MKFHECDFQTDMCFDVYFDDGFWSLSYSYEDAYGSVKIKFCPFCGVELK